jgi:hypothetical protein
MPPVNNVIRDPSSCYGVPLQLEYDPYRRAMSVATFTPPPIRTPTARAGLVTGHGNRTGARRHSRLNPATDTRPAAIDLAEKERWAVELRRAGWTFDRIAIELGYKSRAAARSAVVRGLQRWFRPADDFRALELERTEAIGRELVPLLEHEDVDVRLKAVDRLLKVMDLRARITGLYNTTPRRSARTISASSDEPLHIVEDVERFMVLTGQGIEA